MGLLAEADTSAIPSKPEAAALRITSVNVVLPRFAWIMPDDDFDVDLPHDIPQPGLELRPLIAAVRIKLEQKWRGPKQAGHHQHAAVAVGDIGRMHHRVEEQFLRVYKDMAFLALDLLASVEAGRIDARPPFLRS